MHSQRFHSPSALVGMTRNSHIPCASRSYFTVVSCTHKQEQLSEGKLVYYNYMVCIDNREIVKQSQTVKIWHIM